MSKFKNPPNAHTTQNKISLARLEDAIPVAKLLQRVMYQWKDYFTTDFIGGLIGKNEVYLIYSEGQMAGTISMSTDSSWATDERKQVKWHDESAKALYIYDLAVLPEHQNKGLASELLHEVEEETKKRGIKYLRGAAISDNPNLIEFYKKRNYTVVGKGKVNWWKEDVNFIEKIIK